MPYLLDTNAFSDLVRGHPKVVERLKGLPETEGVLVCSITKG